MPNTLSIDLIQDNGACRPHCAALREIYPSGTIVFDMTFYPQIRDKQVNVFWATPLLPRAIQIELALSWYDRALATPAPSWLVALRAILATPDAGGASTQLGLRLAERRAADPTDALAVSVAGVGYAAAALAGKLTETPADPARIMGAMVVMSQWCAQVAAINESKTMDEVLDELQSSVFQALETHGATLPG